MIIIAQTNGVVTLMHCDSRHFSRDCSSINNSRSRRVGETEPKFKFTSQATEKVGTGRSIRKWSVMHLKDSVEEVGEGRIEPAIYITPYLTPEREEKKQTQAKKRQASLWRV